MSESPQPQPGITLSELQARIREIAHQRDDALARCAVMAGEKAILIEGLQAARAEVERLSAAPSGDTQALN